MMDIDNDIDLVLSQFRSMRTNDKENLIDEFRRLSNTKLSNEGCTFYLDLANWNLNTALWAYYEYDAPDFATLPSAKFICDVTIGEGESVTPRTRFVKVWRIRNTGLSRWPPGCNLRLVNGIDLCDKSIIIIDSLEPNQEHDLSIELTSPGTPGIYQSQYRIYTPTGTPFGDPIWLVLNVDEGGVMGITQQLNSVNIFGQQQQILDNSNNTTSRMFGASPTSQQNPFSNHTNLQIDPNNNDSGSIKQESTGQTGQEPMPDFYDDMFS